MNNTDPQKITVPPRSYWKCRRCGEAVDWSAQKCGCDSSPSPWELTSDVEIFPDIMDEPRPSYDEIWTLLNRIYIARNISLNEEVVHESLRQIDKWLAEPSVGN